MLSIHETVPCTLQYGACQEGSRAGASVLCELEVHSFADSSGKALMFALLLLLESKVMVGSVPLK